MKTSIAIVILIMVTITVMGRMLADEPVAYQPTTTTTVWSTP